MKNDLTNDLACAEKVVWTAFLKGLKPDPILTISEWADKNRMLSQTSAAEPGKWKTSRTPYLKEIMDELSPSSRAKEIVFMKGSQVGGTECGNNWLAYCIDHAPAPMMCVQPTDGLAKRYSKQRIDPLINETESLKGKVKDKRSRDSGNTMLQKDFPGGTLILTGANSAAGLRSMPIKYVFFDEVDAYPSDVDGEGDPLALGKARTRTFSKRKIAYVSTPTIEGLSSIESLYESSDKRKYNVPCPQCHEKQVLKWSNLKWPKTEEGEHETHKVVYVCDVCGFHIQEHHKTWMLENGEWVAEEKESNGKRVGFHISALYSPLGWYSWEEVAEDFLKAKKDPEKLKSFVNTVLGQTWKEKGESPDWETLYRRREDYKIGEVPKGGLFLTAGVDVQKDRIEIEVVAWGRGKVSWSIDHEIFMGDTSSFENPVYKDLAEYIDKDFLHENGVYLNLQKVAVDSGYNTQEVYSWVRKQSQRKVMAVKGSDNQSVAISGPKAVDIRRNGKKLRRGLKLWLIGTGILKDQLYGYLKIKEPLNDDEDVQSGYCHFPEYGEEYFLQLTAEQMVMKKSKKGYFVRQWFKNRDRNEVLDMRVYATAAAISFGMDRFDERDWLKFEKELGIVNEERVKSSSPQKTHRKKIKRKKSNYWK